MPTPKTNNGHVIDGWLISSCASSYLLAKAFQESCKLSILALTYQYCYYCNTLALATHKFITKDCDRLLKAQQSQTMPNVFMPQYCMGVPILPVQLNF